MSRSEKDPQAMENNHRAGAAVLPVCSICSEVPELGIRGVIRVGKAWLCQTCELEITLLEVGSAEYGVMLKKIKKVWE